MKISLCYKINELICEKIVKYEQEKKASESQKGIIKTYRENPSYFLKNLSVSHEIRHLVMKASDCATWEIFHA